LKKQDWEDKIEERLHQCYQSYQSSSIYINLKLHQSEKYNKLRNSKLKNIKNEN